MENLKFSTPSLSKAVCEANNMNVKLFAFYPKLKQFRIKQSKNKRVFIIRAKYGKRSLYVTKRTIEEAILQFLLEFQVKVLGIELKTV